MNNNELTFKEIVIGLAIFFGVIFLFSLGLAKLVYNDFRCAVADCRIIK